MDKIMSDKERLIAHLEILRDAEESKPVNQRDNELIEACIVLLLDLQGKKLTLTEEEIKERVRNFPFVADDKIIDIKENIKGKNKKVSKKKVLLVAACIAILVALFSIASIAFEWNVFEELKNRFGTVEDTPFGVQYEFDGVTVVTSDEELCYASIDQAVENEGLDILIPKYLPEGIKITKISLFEYGGKERILYIFNDSSMFCEIVENEPISDEAVDIATETLLINDKMCYFCFWDDVSTVQVYFEYNNNLYQLRGDDKQTLVKIIENLEEVNNED